MKELIEVFKMKEIHPTTRINLIINLGKIINHKYGANLTEPLVYELVKLINPDYEFSEVFNKIASVESGKKINPVKKIKASKCLGGMMDADMKLYEKILDTDGFAYYFNELCLLAEQ